MQSLFSSPEVSLREIFYHGRELLSRTNLKGDFCLWKEKRISQGGVFPSEEAFQRIYEECIENQPKVSEVVKSSYKNVKELFEEYLCAVQEDIFRYAYQCGYEAAAAAFGKGGAA